MPASNSKSSESIAHKTIGISSYHFWVFLVFAINLILFLFFLSVRGVAIRDFDDNCLYMYVRSAIIDGDLDFENEVALTPAAHPNLYRYAETHRTETGRIGNKYTIGYSLLASPFFLIAHGLTLGLNAVGVSHWPADGYSFPYQLLVPLGLILYAYAGMLLCMRLLSTWFEESAAVWAVLALWWGGNLIYYTVFAASWAHGPELFAVVAVLLISCRLDSFEQWRAWLGLGAMTGLAVLVRQNAAVFALFPLAAWLRTARSEARTGRRWLAPSLATGLCLAGGFVLVCIPQLLAWKSIYGRYLVYSYAEEGFDFISPNVLSSLFSAKSGLFAWHPIYLAATAGLLAFAWKYRNLMAAALVAVCALTVYINSSWWCWWFLGFGNRGYLLLFPVFAIGLAFALQWLRSRGRAPAILFLLVLIAWNMNLTALYGTGRLERTESLSLEKVLQEDRSLLSDPMSIFRRP